MIMRKLVLVFILGFLAAPIPAVDFDGHSIEWSGFYHIEGGQESNQ